MEWDEYETINEIKLPNEEHAVPIFRFRVDNASHSGGYHIHLYKIGKGKYFLTNIVFTRIGRQVYASKL